MVEETNNIRCNERRTGRQTVRKGDGQRETDGQIEQANGQALREKWHRETETMRRDRETERQRQRQVVEMSTDRTFRAREIW